MFPFLLKLARPYGAAATATAAAAGGGGGVAVLEGKHLILENHVWE